MNTHTPYAPEISTIARQTPDARRAHWAALPPSLRAILSHMVMWFRVYGSVLAQCGTFHQMDAADLIKAAQTRLHPALDRAKPGTELNARQISMVTALYGFNRRIASLQNPARRATLRQRIIRIRRTAVRRFQHTCWTWASGLRRGQSALTRRARAANFGQPISQIQKPP